LSFDQQQPLFRRISPDTAASLLPRFPDYDQYALLHSRTGEEMRAVVDKLIPMTACSFSMSYRKSHGNGFCFYGRNLKMPQQDSNT
jgi:hypothetical protein